MTRTTWGSRPETWSLDQRNRRYVSAALTHALLFVLVFVMTVLLVTSCESTMRIETTTGTTDIAYRWDAAHQLCFAMLASASADGFRLVSISYVPLSEDRCR